jgi:hypothetical protein
MFGPKKLALFAQNIASVPTHAKLDHDIVLKKNAIFTENIKHNIDLSGQCYKF